MHERAVDLVLTSEYEHTSRWAAIKSIATKMDFTPETLRSWLNKMAVDTGAKPGLTSEQSTRMKALERENRELKRAHEILKGGARPQTQVRVDFIDPHRDEHGVEPLCKALPIACRRCKTLERPA